MIGETDLFGVGDQCKSGHLCIMSDRAEPELDATGGQRVDNLADVVADDAEASSDCVVLDDASEGGLRIIGQRIGFVENDDLEGWDLPATRVLSKLFLRKFLNLVSNDLDSTFVRSIKLKHS